VISSPIHALASRLPGDIFLLLPELELLLFAAGILLIDHWMAAREKYWNAALAMAAVLFSGYTLWMLRGRVAVEGELLGFHDVFIVDAFFLFFAALVLAILALVILLSAGSRQISADRDAKYFALLLCACIGMMLMLSGIDLLVILLGIEIAALSSHMAMRSAPSESSSSPSLLRYLLTSGFATAILASGFAVLYRTGGSANIGRIGQILDRRALAGAASGHIDWLVIVTIAAILAGLFCKVAALSFQPGSPLDRDDAPRPAAPLVGAAVVAVSAALLLRLLTVLFGASHDVWMRPLMGVAVALLVCGGLATLLTKSVPRLLAYSSISNLGFILLALVAGNETALTGIVFYLVTYALITIGAFAALTALTENGLPARNFADVQGLYQRSAAAATLLTIFLLALAGMPPLAGFISKYLIMKALFESKHPYLVGAAALSLVAGVLGGLRHCLHVWRKQPEPPPRLTINSAQAVVVTIAAFATVVAGLYPEPFLRLARYAFGP